MGRKGFTLIELILVIAIIAILAGAMVPMINASRDQAKVAKAQAECDSIKTAAVLLHADSGTGVWPADGTVGASLVAANGTSGWQGPYVDKWPTDPWGNPYRVYNATGTNQSVCSYGKNGTFDNCNFTGVGDDIAVFITARRDR